MIRLLVRSGIALALLVLVSAVSWATAPTVLSTSPTHNANNISATANITINFDQSMSNSSITTSTVRVFGSLRGLYTGSFSYGSNSATFNPDSSFKPEELIFVTVTTGVQNASSEALANPYVFSFTTSAPAGYGKFKGAVNYTAYSGDLGNIKSIAADIDNDGDLDIITVLALQNQVSVFKNNGDGTFASPVNYTDSNTPLDVVAADVDNDGDLDLLIANNGAQSLTAYINDGTGAFSTSHDYGFSPVQSTSNSLVAADMNGDGYIDVVETDSYYDSLHVMINNGSGAFTNAYTSATPAILHSVTAVDIDNDGDMDIVAVDPTDKDIRVYTNDGTGKLTIGTTGGGLYTPSAMAMYDFNNDGLMDAVTADGSDNNINVLISNNPVLFFNGSSYSAGSYPASITTADVDADNDADILVGNEDDSTFSLLLNNGSFGTATNYPLPTSPQGILSADVNGDGRMDVIASGNGTVSVMLNYNGGHVSSVSPVDNAINVDSTTNINIVFDINIDQSTLTSSNVRVNGSVSGSIAGSFSYNSSTYTATFNPTNNFKPGEKVTVTVTTGVKDVNGIVALQSSYASMFTVGAGGGNAFGPPTNYAAGTQPQSVIAVDVNGDGYPDLVTADYAADSISVLLNNGNGTYASAVHYYAGNGPSSVAAGDIDNDGDIDLVVATTNDNVLSVFKNNGSGTFASRTTVSTSTGPNYVTLADINNDGYLDAVYTTGSQAHSQTNDGSGNFGSEYNYTTGNAGVAVVDVNNDGYSDVVSLYDNGGISTIYVEKNNGSGAYSPSSYSVGTSPKSFVAGDFNNDGYVDIVTANNGAGTISFLSNNGNGTFASKVDFSIGVSSHPVGIAALDVDGDGDLDIAVTDSSTDYVYIFTNNGSGTFTLSAHYSTGDGPYALASADVDGDGDLDLITANYNGNNISVLKNSTQVQISSLSPTINSLNVTKSSNVTVTFNQAMNSGTLTTSTIEVYGSLRGKYSGTVSYNSGTHAATFDPTNDFGPGENITVLVKTGVQNGDGVSLSTPYRWSFTVAASAQGSFGARQDYAIKGTPTYAVTADMNGDGLPDVVTANQSNNNVSVLLNDGSGGLGTADTTYVGATSPTALAVADLNGDGYMDVVTTNKYGSNSISVLMNNGSGGLNTPVTYPVVDNNLPGIAIGDINGDGYNDIIVVNYTNNQDAIFLNNGDGTFTAQTPVTTGTGPWGVTLSDVDGDGDLDIISADDDGQSISVLKNNGDGTFAAKTTYSIGSVYPNTVVAGDVDGDGDNDLVTSNANNGNVTVLLNDGSGTFSVSSNYSTNNPSSAILMDADGDGNLDIVTSETSLNKVAVLKNNGNGTFQSATYYSVGSYPQSVSGCDIDGDGDLDIVAANNGDTTISVLKNVELVNVSSVSPSANALNIAASSNITATFSTSMNSATLVDSTVIVKGSLSGKISGAISYDGPSKTMTFNPTSDFLPGEEVSITLTSDIKDTSGVGLLQSLTYSFMVHASGSGNFAYQDTMVDNGYTRTLTPGDIDGDGKVDLIGADDYINRMKFFRNNSGTFDSLYTITGLAGPDILKAADLDNDGDLDFIAASTSANTMTPIINNGDGTFTAKSPVTIGYNNVNVVLKDIDNDGKPDVVVNGGGSQQVYIYYDDAGNYSYSGYSYFTDAYGIKDFAAADVDNDGYNDIITAHNEGSGADYVDIIRNVGDRTFASPVKYSIGNDISTLAAADVNGDGYIDVIVGNSDSLTFSVMLNNGDGTFGTPVDYEVGYSVGQIVPGDINGDGKIDLVIHAYDNDAGVDKVLIAYNDGNGKFYNQQDVDIKVYAYNYYSFNNIALMDFDNDGALDFVVQMTDGTNQLFGFYKNSTVTATVPTTAASSISTSDDYGTQLKIHWTNGDGSRRLVLVKQGSAVDAKPTNNGNYSPNPQFGSGSQIGSGNYAVYGGAGPFVTVSGLSVNTKYYVSVFEMNGTPGGEVFDTTSAPTSFFTTNSHEGYAFDTTAGYAMEFDSSSSPSVDLPVSSVPNDMTVQLWVQTTDSSRSAVFFARGQGGLGPFVKGGGPLHPVMKKSGGNKKPATIHAAKKKSQQSKIYPHKSSSKPGINTIASNDFNYPIQTGIDNGHIYLSVYDDANSGNFVTITDTATVHDNQWYNVAFTMAYNSIDQSSEIHLYVNGVESADSANIGYFTDYGSEFLLGYDGVTYFDGKIDEVQIRNTVHSLSDIRQQIHRTISGFPTDIAGYWQFNEGTGTSSTDLMGGNTATLNSVLWDSSTVPIGYGTSSTTTSFQTGTAAVGNASLTMTDGFDNPVDVVCTQVEAPPNQYPVGYSAFVGDKYFVIDIYGDPGAFTASLTLNFGANTLDPNVDTHPEALLLYKRESSSTGGWTTFGGASSANSATGDVTWTGITSFSEWGVGQNNQALPVEMASFNATAIHGTVNLQWSTATELNLARFEVERYMVGAQGSKKVWTTIGTINGHGTTNKPQTYSFMDKAAKGTVQYRLKKVNTDGTFQYTQTIEVKVVVPLVYSLSQNYPNPFNPTTTILYDLPEQSHVSLDVYDILGRKVKTLVNEVKPAGEYSVMFDGSSIASGVYFYRIQANNYTSVKKLLLEK